MTDKEELRAAIEVLKETVGGFMDIPLAADMPAAADVSDQGISALNKLDARMCEWHTELEAAVKDLADICENDAEAQCPCCGNWQDDDGFGVLHCEACGYCAHSARTGGVCNICGTVCDD